MTLGEIRNVVNNIAKYKGLNDNTEVTLIANDISYRDHYKRYGEVDFEPN